MAASCRLARRASASSTACSRAWAPADNLSAGESTFMVEMRETRRFCAPARAVRWCDLDEIGARHSTFVGYPYAWAVAEYLDEVVGCGRCRHALPELRAWRSRASTSAATAWSCAANRTTNVVFLRPPGAWRGQSQLRRRCREVGRLARAVLGARARSWPILGARTRAVPNVGQGRQGLQGPAAVAFRRALVESRSQIERADPARGWTRCLTGLEALSLLSG